MTGTIFNIQHYAVHDGPGIRTLVFLKGCPLRCRWCCNPESQWAKPQLRYIGFRCKLCLECVAFCPSSSVRLLNGSIHRSFDLCKRCTSKICVEKCNYGAVAISGMEMNSDELTEIISRDIPFYRNSGGGVTFSGGEPLMQPSFLADVLQKCKTLNIHTAVETCGWAEKSAFRQILPFTDLFLYDLKVVDPGLHQFYTGKPPGPIFENLAYLVSEKADILIRFPLIPGITDTPQNLSLVSEILVKHGLSRICMVPYHTLGTDKYGEHGMDYHLDEVGNCNAEQIDAARSFFQLKDIQCEVV